jgi:3-oxoacyl-(acyl-carrier-protein) synthase
VISPQNTAGDGGFLTDVVESAGDYLKCIEPVYRGYIDPILGRRMSRLIKMGITSAKMCMADSGLADPDAIITGTGLGSVEDTEKILGEITVEERFLNPTPFIQSTYNTISSQIAINLKCHGYNSTYVHRTFSFESGLLDAILQFAEGSAEKVLVGGIDEMTPNHLAITRRLGYWKEKPVSNLALLSDPTPGAIAGEGSAYFLLGKEPGPSVYARLKDVKTVYIRNSGKSIRDYLPCFLQRNGLTPWDIDLVLLGMNGDTQFDQVYHDFAGNFFAAKPQAWFKHLCGEYHTASGFALYLAANILKSQKVPDILQLNPILPGRLKNILIYNQYLNTNHSLLLVQQA